MTPAEFETLKEREHKALFGDRPHSLPPPKWNTEPEKLIVFTFASKDPTDKTTQVRWYAGAFQRDGLWYFASRRP